MRYSTTDRERIRIMTINTYKLFSVGQIQLKPVIGFRPLIYCIKCLFQINKNTTAKLIVVSWVTDWFGNLYRCMFIWALLPKAKLKWIKNVMIFKITIKCLKHSLFENVTKNRRDWYWPIVIFVLPRAFLKNWGNFCQFKFIGKNATEKRIINLGMKEVRKYAS